MTVFCGLCEEPKVRIALGIELCPHCDTTINCPGARCGACMSGREKQYKWGDDEA